MPKLELESIKPPEELPLMPAEVKRRAVMAAKAQQRGHHEITPDSTGVYKQGSFEFTGLGSEFFRIWIVNLMLLIVTLGVYSAWAKVRTRRYFYGNTKWRGNAFEYLAQPKAILKSRMVAIALLLVYSLMPSGSNRLAWGLFLLLYLAMPWIIYRSLHFNARVSRFRNVRFDFDGSLTQAYWVYLGLPVIAVVAAGFQFFMLGQVITALASLALMYPKIKHAQIDYRLANSHYGNQAFEYKTDIAAFYIAFIILALVYGLVTMPIQNFVESSLWPLYFGEMPEISFYTLSGLVPGLLAMFFVLSFTSAFLQARTHQLSFHQLEIGQHRLETETTILGFWLIYLIYWGLMIISLGLAWPWFQVTLASYKASNTRLVAMSNFEEVKDTGDHDRNAIGEELAEAFDLGGL